MEPVTEEIPESRRAVWRNAVRDPVHLAWLTAFLVVAVNIWQRFLVRDEAIAVLFGACIVVALVADLTWKGVRHRPLVEKAVIQPFLFLLSILPMLWYLFLTWWGGIYQGSYLAGNLVPYSDAELWVHGAKSLLATGELNGMSVNRPLGICMFATFFAVTDYNYQQALLLMVLFAGAATFFGAREVWLTGGIAAAVLFITLSTFAVSPFLPLFMTETPGYTLGCLGLAYLLRGFRRGSFRICLVGLGFLTLAMITRTGSLLVVPFVALYMLYFFRGGFKNLLLKAAAVAVVGGTVVGMSASMGKLVGPEGAEFQGNAYYVLYGIASGGKGWEYVFKEHPEIHDLPSDGEKARYARSLFRQKFAENPSLFFRVVFILMGAAFRQFPSLLFFKYDTIWQPPPMVPASLAFLAVILLVYPAFRRKTPWGFLVLCPIAMVLSMPLVPLETGLRFNAATYAFPAALAASAIALLTARWRTKPRENPVPDSLALTEGNEAPPPAGPTRAFTVPSAVQAVFSVLLVATMTVIPLLLSLGAKEPPLPKPTKSEGTSLWHEVVFYHHPSSGVSIGLLDHPGELMEAFIGRVLFKTAFGAEVNLHDRLHVGDYFCDVFLPGETSFYVLFSEVPRTSTGETQAGYLRATLRPIYVEKPWPKVYRVEHYEFLHP